VGFADTYVLEELASTVFRVEGTDQLDAEVSPLTCLYNQLPLSPQSLIVAFYDTYTCHITGNLQPLYLGAV
jgi:hypothetical protein